MAVEVTVEFIKPATIRVKAEVYDDNDALVDPTSMVCDVIDKGGTKVVNGDGMTKTDTGKYEYYYTLLSTSIIGEWTARAISTDGSGGSAKVSIGEVEMKVKN